MSHPAIKRYNKKRNTSAVKALCSLGSVRRVKLNSDPLNAAVATHRYTNLGTAVFCCSVPFGTKLFQYTILFDFVTI